MGIFTSVAVLLMGIKLADSSVKAIANPHKSLFSTTVVIILVLSIFVKFYMYCYNKRFAKITDSETLKATAADCISDSVATTAVLISSIISYITNIEIDGYCGVLVSAFIIFAGVKKPVGSIGKNHGKGSR